MKLSNRQISFLRGLGQGLKPTVMVGHQGYSPQIQQNLEDAFRTRELVKVRILQNSEEAPKELAQQMADTAHAVLVGVVGKTFVVYRPNSNLRDRIDLPSA